MLDLYESRSFVLIERFFIDLRKVRAENVGINVIC